MCGTKYLSVNIVFHVDLFSQDTIPVLLKMTELSSREVECASNSETR